MSLRMVLDSFAVISFLENELGAPKVAEFIKQARDKEKPLLMSVVNWGEVYYILNRTVGKASAKQAMNDLETLPIELVDVDRELAMVAAELKATRKMSYADCFAAALALTKKAELVTGDREFKEVEGEIKIHWLEK